MARRHWLRSLNPVLLGLCCSVGWAAEDESPAGDPDMASHSDWVEVTASRLSDVAEPAGRVPAHVTVIDRARIAASPARTLQELLALEAGAVLYDEVGNGVETTFDLRGFGGTGTRIFLDGVPLNAPRNNTAALELVPLDALERIEIIRGPAAALAGGGSEAGVIQLHTRTGRSREASGAIAAATGTFGATRYRGEIGGSAGALDYFVSGADDDSDGFRDNAQSSLRRLGGTLGWTLGDERRVQLAVFETRADLGNPGALTVAELDDDPAQAPFNVFDFSEQRARQAALAYHGRIGANLSLAAQVFARARDARRLTTGRAASTFGGFFLESDESSRGATVQLTHAGRLGSRESRLALGLEGWQGETDARGTPTPPADPSTIDPAAFTSDNTVDRTSSALFVQDTVDLHPHWTLMAGARLDRDRAAYDEQLPDPALDRARSFSELSWRAGATWHPTERLGVYASYGESFLPPTTEQLFAFPDFGSNPDLRPEDTRSYEVGYHGRWEHGQTLDLALFLSDTADEIVFDPDSLLGLFGANVNGGATRRVGFEAALRGPVTRRLDGFVNVTLLDAEFRDGAARGHEVPLVPRERVAAGLAVMLPARLAVRGQVLHVGEQVLDNDDDNAQPELAAYTVVDLRLSWSLAREHGEGSRRQALTLYGEALNAFDRRYATRGIYAFNFEPDVLANAVFLTPAPGRRYVIGAEWRF